jgi:hypothetical protein
LFVFLVSQVLFAQSNNEIIISAKIIADSSSVDKVNIINIRTEKATTSDQNGNFKISVQLDDVLLLSAINLETRRKTITADDIKLALIIFKMNPKINALQEVVVSDKTTVKAEDLGIIPYGQRKYTPAERKLYTANSGLLDPLLNKISGRTKMLKKEVVVERNEKLLVKFDGLFEDQYYTETLRIPADYIKGFQYFLIEDDDFVVALRSKNKTMIKFLIKKLASDYRLTIAE